LKVKKNVLKKKAKSFYFASIFLSRDCFTNCSQLYNFCRIVDDIADNNYKNKKFLLKNIYNSIAKPDSFKSKYVSEIKPLIKSNIINKACLKELIHGVMLDTKKKISILDKSELINYAYYVAGTVGIMMAKILNTQNKYAYRYAVDLGIAMQLTNIIRDIIEDAGMNRVYYPKVWIKLTSKNILENNSNTIKNINKATEKLFELSEEYYKSAFKGIAFLPFRSRFAILLALFVYRQIGRKIIKNSFSNLKKREIVSLYEKILCLLKVFFVFIFNFNTHFKKYQHDKNLHDTINSKTFLKSIIYEQK